jgi:hypothetical protein
MEITPRFRAKTRFNTPLFPADALVYGDLIHEKDNAYLYLTMDNETYYTVEVQPETIQECTNLQDCRGCFIYGGDFIKCDGVTYEVFYSELHFAWMVIEYYTRKSKHLYDLLCKGDIIKL